LKTWAIRQGPPGMYVFRMISKKFDDPEKRGSGID